MLLLLRYRLCLLALFCFCLGQRESLCAQSWRPASGPTWLIGTSDSDPNDVSGLWEAADGHGGRLWMHLLLSATAPATATTLTAVSQQGQSLEVSFYDRPRSGLRSGEGMPIEGFVFGGNAHYDSGYLTMQVTGYGVDLVMGRQRGSIVWRGTIRRLASRYRVVFRRPMQAAGGGAAESAFAGTWLLPDLAAPRCLHIAKESRGQYVAWADELLLGGRIRFAPGVVRWQSTTETYGSLIDVDVLTQNDARITFGAYGGLCCAHPFLASVVGRGQVMKAHWESGPNQSPHDGAWRKMPDNSCIASR